MTTPKPAPDLHIPASPSTVSVSIIDTTTSLRGVQTAMFFSPSIPGHTWLGAPAYSFLIQHPAGNRTLIFDLGIRKDVPNLSPAVLGPLKAAGFCLDYEGTVTRGVREILDAGGVDTAAVEAVIWSHYHFDHTGDPSTFDPATKLIVGPGFREHILPGYPANPASPILETDYTGRELVQLDFDDSNAAWKTLTIGRFKAIDYFGDGSFYLLDAPGHAIGHVCGLARVTSAQGHGGKGDSFIFMGGDAFHHGGEVRPSEYLPLPDEISPSPFAAVSSCSGTKCPGAMFESLLAGADRTKTFYTPSNPPGSPGNPHHDPAEGLRTIGKLQEGDAHDNVFVVAAHDETLLDVVEFFPATANAFVEKEWVQKARWLFLRDFADAAGYQGERAWRANSEWGPI
ncbi:beta-lactamase-like protein [Podospora appendiculata]|uniref:Beta-lactamase-like protein n=1 Tax=Podospora appendiculata TaxID=314037 RepID=A0AAE0XGQ8_9PEZI|nr:beta-lactamase-like protein [Podospora appendiculata]